MKEITVYRQVLANLDLAGLREMSFYCDTFPRKPGLYPKCFAIRYIANRNILYLLKVVEQISQLSGRKFFIIIIFFLMHRAICHWHMHIQSSFDHAFFICSDFHHLHFTVCFILQCWPWFWTCKDQQLERKHSPEIIKSNAYTVELGYNVIKGT
jgi:hypothetical protein